ncbi:Acetylglutamate kinase [Candidatus Magnetomorum sp. HK-1]|nr:Acetylglutamate kinase [Candidatus Magnetomorum sp. HK-1]
MISNTTSTPNIADILIESLPYIQQFYGSTIVIKYGGHAMVDEQLKTDFARDIVLLKYIGINPVIVHGGGPQINKVLEQMGITPTFIRGMRVTDKITMDVVEMVLGGRVNKSIVNQINQQKGKAVGLTGKDGGLLIARKMRIMHQSNEDKPPEIIDPGMVGEVISVHPEIIHTLTQKGFIPIIAPVGVGASGETYNINADLVASKIAQSLNARRLVLLTDVDGVKDASGKLISTFFEDQVQEMIHQKIISGGMIPKIECAVEAINKSVNKVHIINGCVRHAVILELFTNKGIGTEVKCRPSKNE